VRRASQCSHSIFKGNDRHAEISRNRARVGADGFGRSNATPSAREIVRARDEY